LRKHKRLNRQFPSFFISPPGQNPLAVACFHSFSEAVRSFPFFRFFVISDRHMLFISEKNIAVNILCFSHFFLILSTSMALSCLFLLILTL